MFWVRVVDKLEIGFEELGLGVWREVLEELGSWGDDEGRGGKGMFGNGRFGVEVVVDMLVDDWVIMEWFMME